MTESISIRGRCYYCKFVNRSPLSNQVSQQIPRNVQSLLKLYKMVLSLIPVAGFSTNPKVAADSFWGAYFEAGKHAREKFVGFLEAKLKMADNLSRKRWIWSKAWFPVGKYCFYISRNMANGNRFYYRYFIIVSYANYRFFVCVWEIRECVCAWLYRDTVSLIDCFLPKLVCEFLSKISRANFESCLHSKDPENSLIPAFR